MWIAKSVVVDASPTRVTALPAPDGGVVVIAPAVESDKKNKSPAFRELNVFNPTTITFHSFSRHWQQRWQILQQLHFLVFH